MIKIVSGQPSQYGRRFIKEHRREIAQAARRARRGEVLVVADITNPTVRLHSKQWPVRRVSKSKRAAFGWFPLAAMLDGNPPPARPGKVRACIMLGNNMFHWAHVTPLRKGKAA